MSGRPKDLTGQIRGGLRYIALTGERNGSGNVLWDCECLICGRHVSARPNRSSRYKSCGCLRNERADFSRDPKTGKTQRIYSIWNAMRDRCYNPKNRLYHAYGGKGITVCPEWQGKDGFIRFREWAFTHGFWENTDTKNRAKSASLDRIDADKPYSPGNCQWLTLSQNVIKGNRERRKSK